MGEIIAAKEMSAIEMHEEKKENKTHVFYIFYDVFLHLFYDERDKDETDGDGKMTEQLANFCTIIGAVAGIIGIIDFCAKRRKPSLIAAIIGAALLLAVYLPHIPDNTDNASSRRSGGTTATTTTTYKDPAGYSAVTSNTGIYERNTNNTSTQSTSTTNNLQMGQTTGPISVATYIFSSSAKEFPDKLNKEVFTGPGSNYLRAAEGKAQFSSKEYKYGGRVGNWVFVRCSVTGGIRYGWIYIGEYQQTIQSIPSLEFGSQTVSVNCWTEIWDSLMDPDLGPLGSLESGTKVTYLCNFKIDGTTYAYVETSISGMKVRGFVDPRDIQ